MNDPVDYFDSESLRKDLKGKTVRGGIATSVAQAAGIAIGLTATPVLARLLDPSDFGLVAMVAVFAGLAPMFIDAGLSMATVQREEISRQQVTNLFWLAAFLGCLVAAVMAATAPLVSMFYGEPRLTPIILALAGSFVMSGLAVQHQALLRRGMQFDRIAAANLVAMVVGNGVGVAWAFLRAGQPDAYWALVFIPIATTVANAAAVWSLCPWRPGLPRRGAGSRPLLMFGATLMWVRLVNYFARNGDNVIIGWFWGAGQLGYYSLAYKLLMLPANKLHATLGGVVVAALSRLRGDDEKYREAFRAATRPLVWVGFPLVGLLFCICDPLVLLYLGPKWGPAVPLFRALSPAALATVLVACSGWVYASWGHVSRHLKWTAAHSAVLLVTIAACVPFGVYTTACGVSAAYVLLRPIGFFWCFQGTAVRLSDLGDVIWRPLLMTVAACVATVVLAHYFIAYEADAGWSKIAQAAILISCLYAGLFVAQLPVLPGAVTEIRQMMSVVRLRGKSPSLNPEPRQA